MLVRTPKRIYKLTQPTDTQDAQKTEWPTNLLGRLLHVGRFEIGAEADDITVFVARQPLLVGELQHVEEVLGDVVVLLEEEHQA